MSGHVNVVTTDSAYESSPTMIAELLRAVANHASTEQQETIRLLSVYAETHGFTGISPQCVLVTDETQGPAPIMTEGEPFDGVYIIMRGEVDVHVQETNETYTRSAPVIVGDMAAITGTNNATITPHDGCEFLKIPGKEYTEALNTNQELGAAAQELYRFRVARMLAESEVQITPERREELLEWAKTLGATERLFLEKTLALSGEFPEGRDIGIHTYNGGEDLISQDEPTGNRRGFSLLRGKVDIFAYHRGTPIYLGTRDEGSVIGERGVLNPQQPRSATVTAKTGVQALVISEKVMRRLGEDPELRTALQKLHEERMEETRTQTFSYDQSLGVGERKDALSTLSSDAILEKLRLGIKEAKNRASIDELIHESNAKYPPHNEHVYAIMERFPWGIVYVNDRGFVESREIDKSNARKVLGELKLSEENTYEMRMECVRRSEGQISTEEAYLTVLPPPPSDLGHWRFIAKKEHLVPERESLHTRIEEEVHHRAVELSQTLDRSLESMGLARPALIIMKGNTGAGKTTTLGSQTPFISQLGLMNKDRKIRGVINPDELKNPLREEAKIDGQHTISHFQALREGAILNNRIVSKLAKEKRNVVIDKRFCTLKEFERDAYSIARDNGYKTIVVIDVDAEYQTSRDRVHGNASKGIKGRDPDGDDPIVSEKAILNGFSDTRKERKAIQQFLVKENMKSDGIACNYLLLKTDVPGRSAAEPLVLGTLHPGMSDVQVSKGQEALYAATTTPVDRDELKKLSQSTSPASL